MKAKIKAIVFHVVRKIGRLFYRKHVWLVSDREYYAGDNGEAFFKFLQTQDVNSVFAISKESEDYERMTSIGKVVPYRSVLHKLLLCVSDVHISSQLIHMDTHQETPQVFLQHGITYCDLHDMINAVSHENFYIITSGRSEAMSMCSLPYVIKPDHVWLTGMPRFDTLQNRAEKQVVISFTWRQSLVNVTDEDFKESRYYKVYSELLNDALLIDELELLGYRLCIKLHPEMKRYLHNFTISEKVQMLNDNYNEIFAKGSLLITDYSSIVSDFVYLYKPVIYYQFDYDTFFSGTHTYVKGYFDYERDGFGDVITDYSSLKRVIIDSINKDCEMSVKYKTRVNDFFAYIDKDNSKRVFEKIKSIL